MARATRQKKGPATPAELADIPDQLWAKLYKRTQLLRSIGKGPLSEVVAERIAKALGVGRASVYRWHSRFRAARTVSALAPRGVGFPKNISRLQPAQELIIRQTIESLRRKGQQMRVVDVLKEVEQRCRKARISAPSRRSVDRRLHRDPQIEVDRRKGAQATNPPIVPGTFSVRRALEVVQIDHTKVDLIVVDDLYRIPVGRPYLTLALDVATRSVLAFRLTFDPPGATSVALCLAQTLSTKDAWLASLGLQADWPMAGLPSSIHLDNAAEFHSKALERGCQQFGIEVVYRPRGRPHYGGHIERLIGTLMQRLGMLPGATGNSTKGRKRRAPEKHASMTLRELEQWFALEVGGNYHQAHHRGLQGSSPLGAWNARPPVVLQALDQREVLLSFLPAEPRRVRRDGVHLNNIRYWHPIFSSMAIAKKSLLVHYDPRDLSRLYARSATGDFLEIPYADLRNPPISIWEYRAALKHVRDGAPVDEAALFRAIERQRALVVKSQTATRRARQIATVKSKTKVGKTGVLPSATTRTDEEVDDSDSVISYTGEVWP